MRPGHFCISLLFLLLSLPSGADSLENRYVISGPLTDNSGNDKSCIVNKSPKSGSTAQFFSVKCTTATRVARKAVGDDGDLKLLRVDEKDLSDQGIKAEDVCTLIGWAARSHLTSCPNSSDLLVWLENEGALNQICKFKSGSAGPDEKQLEKVCRSKGFTGNGYHFNSLPSDGKPNPSQQGINGTSTR